MTTLILFLRIALAASTPAAPAHAADTVYLDMSTTDADEANPFPSIVRKGSL